MDRTIKIALFYLLILILIALMILSSVPYNKPKTKKIITADKYVNYIVCKGDTLWNIAKKRTDGDVREYVYYIKQDNHLDQSTIYEGQVIKLRKIGG